MMFDIRLTLSRWFSDKPETLLIYDLSASMESAWTEDLLQAFHNHPLIKRLESETHLVKYGGGEIPQKLRRNPTLRDFTHPITDFESLLSQTLKKHQSIPDQLIFLTDGQNLKGLKTEQITFPREVTWLVVGVGDTLLNGRFTVTQWDVPRQAVVGDTLSISAQVYYEGEIPAEGYFSLMSDQRTWAISSPVMIENASAVDVSFSFSPQEVGYHFLSLSFHENSESTHPVKGYTRLSVHPRTIAVLILSDPDPDVAFIRKHLTTEERFSFYTPKQWEENHPDEMPDLLLVGPDHLPEKYVSVPSIQVRHCSMEETIVISRFHVSTPLAFTYLNANPILNREIWSRFPPIQGCQNLEGIPVVTDETQKHVAISYNQEKRQLIFNGSGFWRWAWAGYGTEREGAWRLLIKQCAHFLVTSHQQWAWLELPDNALYAGLSTELSLVKGTSEAPATLSGRVSILDSTGSLVWNSSLTSLLQSVTPLTIPGLDAGKYIAILNLYIQGESVGTDSLKFTISEMNPELYYIGCDLNSLRNWAIKQGGQAFSINRWEEGEQFLTFNEKYKHSMMSINFRRNWLWIILLLAMLTAEWIIRKSGGYE